MSSRSHPGGAGFDPHRSHSAAAVRIPPEPASAPRDWREPPVAPAAAPAAAPAVAVAVAELSAVATANAAQKKVAKAVLKDMLYKSRAVNFQPGRGSSGSSSVIKGAPSFGAGGKVVKAEADAFRYLSIHPQRAGNSPTTQQLVLFPPTDVTHLPNRLPEQKTESVPYCMLSRCGTHAAGCFQLPRVS
jgi:hypothetical protein